ncbi:MAG: amino acid transporter [Rhodospirillales bacterium]|nr:amino acid transporter [Rhodospirillales bacterium]
MHTTDSVSASGSRSGAASGAGPELRRVLGPWNLIALGVGSTLGAGLFSLTGIAASEHAGPAVVLAFLVAAIGCGLAALCYAELASMIPVSGSAYTYARYVAGPAFAWIVGWDLVLEYSVSVSTVAVSWAGNLDAFLKSFGLHVPSQLLASPFDTEPGWINLPAVLIICICSVLLIRGVEGSSRVNAIVTYAKCGVVVLFIALGLGSVDTANFHPFVPPNTGEFGSFGWSGVARAAGLIFFAYIGFDAVSTAAQEARNPQRDMPIGLIGALLVCTVLFVAFAAVLVGIVPYAQLKGDAAPIATAAAMTPYPWLAWVVEATILIGFLAVILVTLYGQSRIFRAMAQDGALPGWFGAVHPRFRTPWRADQATMIVSALMAGFTPLAELGELTSIGTLLAFVVVCVAVLVLRRTKPDMKRTFRTPWMPWTPILGILACVALMASLDYLSWLRLVVWLVAGQLLWFFYGRHRARSFAAATAN